ncbi:arylesterase [Uliginosibacterium aquaticum]|uniref:Arylesterase n=1 Tax=Uliginosibacterium aquaticum TaxID=2731212 RepID=A0ABX2ILX8_9RHOO|nr:arylesterase [Uliginosibacterium aquaticum]NSL55125.1 arylesterase [Uliginosibacterium aquaticum]
MSRFIIILFAICSIQNALAANILVWGDSLSAGYGIAQEQAWPQLLSRKLVTEGYRHTVINASISGETSAGGLTRLPAALTRDKPSIVIIELGANDGLRGLPVPAMRKNLDAMIRSAQASGARVMLIGMRMPPNFGPVYTQKFQQTYSELAQQYKTALLPFMMEGFAERSELFQGDNLHPTAEAQPLILANVWSALKPLLRK